MGIPPVVGMLNVLEIATVGLRNTKFAEAGGNARHQGVFDAHSKGGDVRARGHTIGEWVGFE